MAPKALRTAQVSRATKETAIEVSVNLDGTGKHEIATGIGFLDHMIEQFSRHSLIDITCRIEGDLHVDQHHTTEDSAIAIGQALSQAMGDKAGIERYGHARVPMMECLSDVTIDLCGRPFLVYEADLAGKVGEFDLELAEEFFRSVATIVRITARFRYQFWLAGITCQGAHLVEQRCRASS